MDIDTTKPVILTFVGMPGAGKSSCITYITDNLNSLPPVLYFGGITMDEVARRGLDINEANEKLVREDIRAKEGLASHAKRIAGKIDNYINQGHTRILVDGLYSWTEYKFFKQKYGNQAIIVAVAAPRQVRHQRLVARPVRPLSAQDAAQRDYNEIENLEKGGPIANADYTLVNGTTEQHLYSQLHNLLLKLKF